jgi:predicted DNA-binding transcriptional regulator YafY
VPIVSEPLHRLNGHFDDWRTFRIDRISGAQLAGGRFAPRDIRGGGGAAFFAASIASIPREFETLVAVRTPYDQIAEELSWVDHTPVDTEADSCTIRLRAAKRD